MFYYIDLNGVIDSYYSDREDAVASFKALHASLKPNGSEAYGLHRYDKTSYLQDVLLTCSESEWEAEWEEAHPEAWD
jgi:hypothetical protein